MPIADALDRRTLEREQEDRRQAAEDYRLVLFELADIPDTDWTAEQVDRLADALTRGKVHARDAQDDLAGIRRVAQQEARLPKLDADLDAAVKSLEQYERQAVAGKHTLAEAESIRSRLTADRAAIDELKKKRKSVADDVRNTRTLHARVFPRQ